jgi:hypothetical protein
MKASREAEMQNGGLHPAASRNQLGRWLQQSFTASEAQALACRFCLSPSMARDMARLCFGEARND